MKFALVLVAALSGCTTTKPNPASCADNHCNDPARPFCDVDGSIGGEPDTCIAVECMAGTFEACRDDRALMCNATGDNYELVDCMYGCSAEAGGCNACNTSDCEKHIIPKYLSNVCNQLSEGESLTFSSTTLDTSVPLNCHSVVAQPGGPEICVFHRSSISIDRNQTVRFIGTRAIALVADRDLLIDGVLDVAAEGSMKNGPGGGFVKSGGAAGALAQFDGGGGSGFRLQGGSGGSANADGGVGNGGAAQPSPSQSLVLLGGPQPERNNEFDVAAGGGGAATLISCRGTVSVPGLIDAGGGGGEAGRGGGAGGYVVLQGMMVSITGELYANGGGGGGGFAGQDGSRSASMPAAGGATGPTSHGAGGDGAVGLLPPAPGRKPVAASGNGGGGGGSTGYFQTYTPENVAPLLTPLAVSPRLEVNGTVPTN